MQCKSLWIKASAKCINVNVIHNGPMPYTVYRVRETLVKCETQLNKCIKIFTNVMRNGGMRLGGVFGASG